MIALATTLPVQASSPFPFDPRGWETPEIVSRTPMYSIYKRDLSLFKTSTKLVAREKYGHQDGLDLLLTKLYRVNLYSHKKIWELREADFAPVLVAESAFARFSGSRCYVTRIEDPDHCSWRGTWSARGISCDWAK